MKESSLLTSSIVKILIPVFYLALCVVYFYLELKETDLKIHHVVGISLVLIAFVLWIVARVQLGNAFTITAQAKYLVTKGLYGKLRHPVYYFSILAVIGLAIFTWNIFMIIPVVLIGFIQILRIKNEESVLEKTFGSEYAEYRASTWF